MKDVAAERGVISGLFKYGHDAFIEVDEFLSENTFTVDSNQFAFKCLKHILSTHELEKVDWATFYSAASGLGLQQFFERADEQKHLKAIMNFPIEESSVRKLGAKIRKLEIARLVIDKLELCTEELKYSTGDEPASHYVGLVDSQMLELSSLLIDGEGPKSLNDGLEEYVNYLCENVRDIVGVSTGFPIYDKAIGGGLRGKTVNVVAARPKTGKTVFGENVALHISLNIGIPVLYCDTEMSMNDHWNREIANFTNIELDDIETGKFSLDPAKKHKVFSFIKEMKQKLPYDWVSINGLPFEDTLSLIRRWIIKKVGLENGKAKPCVIIFDYIKLMSEKSMGANLQEYQALGFLMTSLHNFTVKYDVPCLALAQTTRDGIAKEDSSVISGSDRIIWLCSNFSILKEKTPEEQQEDGDSYSRKIIPVVARHGRGLDLGDYINVTFEGEYARMTEGCTRNEAQVKRKLNDGFAVDTDTEF